MFTLYSSFSIRIIVPYVAFLLLNASCTKLVEVDLPSTSTNTDVVYSTDETAIGVLTGIYSTLSSAGLTSGELPSLPFYTGISSDELTLYAGVTNAKFLEYYKNELTSSGSESSTFWYRLYPLIYTTNSAIDGLNKSSTITSQIKTQLLGEAKFIRAFCYFYLANLYGDVPLALTSDYKSNSLLRRSSKSDVYVQIIQDLKDAKNLLSESYVDGTLLNTTVERTSPNKWSASALLARVYLYIGDFPNAELESSKIIENTAMFSLETIDNAFKKNNKEAIWQLQPVGTFITNTNDARFFIITASGPNPNTRPAYLSQQLINSFELGDLRRSNWVGNITVGNDTYMFAWKYKNNITMSNVTEYLTVFRLAEQYLIRAEARLRQNNIAGGVDDINIIRKRSRMTASQDVPDPLPEIATSISQVDALRALEHERQVELFTEWGHRWLDLKRIMDYTDQSKTRADIILKEIKGSDWQSTDQLYPIPQSEINKNPSLQGNQNPGY